AINRTLFCLFISFFPIFSDNFTIKRCVVFILYAFLNFPYGLIGFYSPELSAILFTIFIGAKLELIIEICSMIEEKHTPESMPKRNDSQYKRRISRGNQSHSKEIRSK
ncbi:MAG: hypothetical protein JXA95_05750, partial [Spirochaetales bacterium]|nr:hypothetical protein [Spirochaetales bacterium]